MDIRENKWIRTVMLYVFAPVVLEMVIEALSRKSLIAGVQYLFSSPLLFIFNTLIIMLTLSIAMFFKREIFVYAVIFAIWLVFGIANFIILHFRVTPFSAVDFTLIKSAISVSGHYFSALNIAMMLLAVILVAIGMILLYKKAPKHKGRSYRNFVISAATVLCLGLLIAFLRTSSSSVQALSTNYTNISEAYENFGFVYCFANSILDTGIARPENYSGDSVRDVIAALETDDSLPSKKPNIIMIQLESFFDINYVKGLSCSKDPIPVFHSLQKKYSHGLLTVPTVGAGTVNTEFEVLTGMNQNDFGVSEYPYKTVLKSTTMESVCYDLNSVGYNTHCVHNNEATFYGRQKVFRNLGFDSFTPMEYMNGLEENPNGWVKDDILTSEIIKTLDCTQGVDFTFGITVQSHGKYDVVLEESEKDIEVLGAPEGKEDSYTYYVNQLAEVDKMIGELINELEARGEDAVLVLYGDHLPSLDLTKDELKNGDLYQTPYAIWDNIGLEKETKNLYSYQLYSEVLKRIGISEGIITRYHQQTDWSSADYLTNLALLEYDLLYGDIYAYGGENPFPEIETRLGTNKVRMTDIEQDIDGGYIVTGDGFTEYSHILFDGDKLEGVWLDEHHIKIDDEFEYDFDAEPVTKEDSEEQEIEPNEIPNAFVVQMIDDDGIVLSTSDALLWEETSLEVPMPPDNEDEAGE